MQGRRSNGRVLQIAIERTSVSEEYQYPKPQKSRKLPRQQKKPKEKVPQQLSPQTNESFPKKKQRKTRVVKNLSLPSLQFKPDDFFTNLQNRKNKEDKNGHKIKKQKSLERKQINEKIAKKEKLYPEQNGNKQMYEKQKGKIQNIAQKLDRIKKLKEKSNTSSFPAIIHNQRGVNTQIPLIDKFYPRPKQVKVYVNEKGFAFSATYSHTNLENNVNRFYIMQILQELKDESHFFLFTRWGRVGLEGQMAEVGPITLQQAIEIFEGKILERMQNGYKKVDVTFENERRNFYFPHESRKNNKIIQCKLDKRVENLIRLLFNITMMNNQMKQAGYDSKKMPLGKIAKLSIIKGYQALKWLLQQVRGKKRSQVINQWNSAFYTHIPHDFGMKNVANFQLNNEEKIKNKLELLQSIEDIQIFTKLIDEIPNTEENIVDINYRKLGINITPLEKGTYMYKKIIQYVENTQSQKHSKHFKLQVIDIFQVQSEVENQRYQNQLDNKYFLWHGSRLTNYVGILRQGLRIAPPEAPVTGYMFGKGIYFADIVSKSAQYCKATRNNPIGCLLLCQVALGMSMEKFYADYNANLMTQEYFSVKGVGKSSPEQFEQIQDGVKMAKGKIEPTGISNTSLEFNEYVVYNVNQIKIRYLLKVKFIFPQSLQ